MVGPGETWDRKIWKDRLFLGNPQVERWAEAAIYLGRSLCSIAPVTSVSFRPMPKQKAIDELVSQIETLRNLLKTGSDLTPSEQHYIRSHLEMLLRDLDLNVKRKPH